MMIEGRYGCCRIKIKGSAYVMERQMKNDILESKLSFAGLIKEMNRYNNEDHAFVSKARVAVIGSASIQYFASILKFILNLRGIDVELYEGPYDGINSCLLKLDPEVVEFSPQFIVILPHYLDIKEYPGIGSTEKDYEDMIGGRMILEELVWKNISQIPDVQVFQCNYVLPYIDEWGNFEANSMYSKNSFIKEINRRMVIKRPAFVTLIDLDAFAAQVGKEKWFDFPGYFSTKTGFDMKFILPVANKIGRLVDAAQGRVRKCLILDLDNTLWGDVVGDVGTHGVVLDPNDPEGESYRFFQNYIKSLKDRGVILAVCSKNDDQVARDVFLNNPDMVLKLDDISCFMANWDDKATNIRRIAGKLNIGIDSLVFVDDNNAERELVRQNLPEVLVIDLPEDVDGYAEALYKSGAFDWLEITREDILRSGSYVTNAKREALEKSMVDYDSYLSSLEMEAQFFFVDEDRLERFVQLINKSNQFNLTTRRIKESTISRMLDDDRYSLMAVYLKDRFSYYGNIACLVLRQDDDRLIIDTFVMSCRVLKRGLEDVILKAVVECAMKRGCTRIIGEYIRTEKNHMVENLYDDFGFELISEEGGYKAYRLTTDSYTGIGKTFIKVV